MFNEKPKKNTSENTFPEIDVNLLKEEKNVAAQSAPLSPPRYGHSQSQKIESQEPSMNLYPRYTDPREKEKNSVTSEQLGSLAHVTLSDDEAYKTANTKLIPVIGAVIEDILGGSDLEGKTIEGKNLPDNVLQWRQRPQTLPEEEKYGAKRAAEDAFGKRGAA